MTKNDTGNDPKSDPKETLKVAPKPQNPKTPKPHVMSVTAVEINIFKRRKRKMHVVKSYPKDECKYLNLPVKMTKNDLNWV